MSNECSNYKALEKGTSKPGQNPKRTEKQPGANSTPARNTTE